MHAEGSKRRASLEGDAPGPGAPLVAPSGPSVWEGSWPELEEIQPLARER